MRTVGFKRLVCLECLKVYRVDPSKGSSAFRQYCSRSCSVKAGVRKTKEKRAREFEESLLCPERNCGYKAFTPHGLKNHLSQKHRIPGVWAIRREGKMREGGRSE